MTRDAFGSAFEGSIQLHLTSTTRRPSHFSPVSHAADTVRTLTLRAGAAQTNRVFPSALESG